jgi:octaprenyl-diphosphate synthase
VSEGVSGAIADVIRSVNDTLFSGKMIRPALVLFSGKTAGEINEKHIYVAVVVEILHNATLLHDDVLDEGGKRRGAPTVSRLLGNESSVLLGDFLLSRVFQMCANLEGSVVKIIAEAAARTCRGELRQVSQRRNWLLDESEYIDIVTEKSAVFFSGCCELGAVLADAEENKVKMLADFGLNFGIGFQITDDLLDIVGDEKEMGKTLGSDADKDKPTLAVIHFLKTAGQSEKELFISKLNAGGYNRKAMIEMLNNFGSLQYAQLQARHFVAKAIDSLEGLQERGAKDALVEIARFVGDRVRIGSV